MTICGETLHTARPHTAPSFRLICSKTSSYCNSQYCQQYAECFPILTCTGLHHWSPNRTNLLNGDKHPILSIFTSQYCFSIWGVLFLSEGRIKPFCLFRLVHDGSLTTCHVRCCRSCFVTILKDCNGSRDFWEKSMLLYCEATCVFCTIGMPAVLGNAVQNRQWRSCNFKNL